MIEEGNCIYTLFPANKMLRSPAVRIWPPAKMTPRRSHASRNDLNPIAYVWRRRTSSPDGG